MTTEVFDKPATLLEAVVVQLKTRRDKDLITLYAETKLPYYWLRKVANGDIKNPSVNRIQYLYEHLTGKKLEL